MFLRSNRNPEKFSDSQLIDRYVHSGNMEWLGYLFNRYIHLIYGVCLKYLKDREESKDATMQIFEKITVSLKTEKVREFNRWIYIVTRNHCLMALRKRKNIHQVNMDTSLMESDYFLHLNDVDIMERDTVNLKKCLDTLPDQQRHCIELFYFNEKCYREIADITSFEMGKVKSYIQNGKRNLKNCLEGIK